jgi:hypothetical protein
MKKGESSLEQVEAPHIIRGFRCLIHGFATIAGHKGFGYPSDAAESFDYCLALYLAGWNGNWLGNGL